MEIQSKENKEENSNFVHLLEDYKIILKKSKNAALKQKKQQAVTDAIEKWQMISKKKLTESAFLKKVSNLKVRTNVAISNKYPLCDWQQKLVEMTKGAVGVITDPIPVPLAGHGTETMSATMAALSSGAADGTENMDVTADISNSAPGIGNKAVTGDLIESMSDSTGVLKLTAEDIVNQFETVETVLLTNEQLQRIILLKQVQLINLQRERFENISQHTSPNNINFELIGFNPPDVIDL